MFKSDKWDFCCKLYSYENSNYILWQLCSSIRNSVVLAEQIRTAFVEKLFTTFSFSLVVRYSWWKRNNYETKYKRWLVQQDSGGETPSYMAEKQHNCHRDAELGTYLNRAQTRHVIGLSWAFATQPRQSPSATPSEKRTENCQADLPI